MATQKTYRTPRAKILSPREREFVRQYMKLSNGTEAYIRAGYTAKTRQTAAAESYKLLRKPHIAQILSDLHAEADALVVDDYADQLRLWRAVVNHDPRELSEIVYDACRYCHGVNHEYHWRVTTEFQKELSQYNRLPDKTKESEREPNDDGGYGYSSKLIPHPDCPMCDGEGDMRVVFHASAMLDKDAAMAFDGVQVTQNGMKVMTIDRMAASEKLAKNLGMFRQKQKAEVVDALSEMISRNHQKGSKAPLNGVGDAPVAEDSASLSDDWPARARE